MRLTCVRHSATSPSTSSTGKAKHAIFCLAEWRTIIQHSSKAHLRGLRSESEIDEVMDFYSRIPQTAATEVLHRWQRNIDYLAAIRELDLG